MTRFAMMLGALALPVALAAQEPAPRDTTRPRPSEPVFLTADSVAKLRAAAASDTMSLRRADTVMVRQAMPVTPAAPAALAGQPATDTLARELSYTPTETGGVWLRSTTTTRGTLRAGVMRGPDGRVFMRPVADGGVWMVAARDGDAPGEVVSAPVAGVTREESAGDVAPALSTSVRPTLLDMSREDIREFQGAMTDAGCSVGAIDGVAGPRTRRAMECVARKYELQNVDLTSLLEALNLRLTSDM